MANKSLPIVFLNLSGEMIYVIQQRLQAQCISAEKSIKVIQDIIRTLLNEQFIDELFKPQDIYSRSSLQSVFEKLVHSSIMRLNQTSMSKLYDLMLMVFKYQVVNCPRPEDMLLITLNHLDAIKDCAKLFPELLKKVENVHSLLMLNYKNLSYWEFSHLRYSILTFLQDLHIRVSVLLKLNLQYSNGDFILQKGGHIPYGFTIPGTVESVTENGETNIISTFPTEDTYSKPLPCGSLEFDGDRITSLGKNIYINSPAVQSSKDSSQQQESETSFKNKPSEAPPALEELGLLVRLIGKCAERDSETESEVVLASIDDEIDFWPEQKKDTCSFVNIDASQTCQFAELNKISEELSIETSKTEKNDILELMDIAEQCNF